MTEVAVEQRSVPFRDALEAQPKHEPDWLRARRKEAARLFSEHGYPHGKLEAWRKTPLTPVTGTQWAQAEGSKAPRSVLKEHAWDLAPHRAVVVNGRFDAQASGLDGLPEGVRVRSVREVLERAPALLEPHLGALVPFEKPEQSLAALNTALFPDGVVVELDRRVVLEEPLQIVFVSTRDAAPAAVFPRALVLAAEQAEATVLESYVGPTGAKGFTDAATEIVLGQSARIDHVLLGRQPSGARHFGVMAVRAGRDATFTSLSFSEGGAWARNEVRVGLVEEGASAMLNGLFLGRGRQMVDNHTWIDHVAPHTTSKETYKGILDDQARGVFVGNVVVRRNAQRISSEQENRNLLLSREALVDTTPQLEINADDVKCTHGSTIGQLDEASLFYLRTRGYTEAEARRVLTLAFAAQVLRGVRSKRIAQGLEALVSDWFKGGAADGGSA